MLNHFRAILRGRKVTPCLLLAVGSPLAPSSDAADVKTKPTALVSVAISQIALMTLSDHVAAYGTVEPGGPSADQPSADVRLSASIAGPITALFVTEGQHVEKGDVLARVDGSNEPSASVQKESVVTAPFSGFIVHLNARVGEWADPAKPLLKIIDPAQLVVKGYVPVDDATSLKVGRPVEISTALANSKVLGTLLSISPIVDESTSGVMVRASVPVASGFRPGQFVKLRIATDEHANILAVPVESLVKDPDVGYVIAFIEGDQATQHPVRVGIRDGDFVEVEGEGVKVGLTVAAEGAYALPKQSKVHVITPVD